MQTTPAATSARKLGDLLNSIATLKARYDNPSAIRRTGDLLVVADKLIDNYADVIELVGARVVDVNTIGVTVDDVDIHVNTVDDLTTVYAGIDDVPMQRKVFIESWDGLSWAQELH